MSGGSGPASPAVPSEDIEWQRIFDRVEALLPQVENSLRARLVKAEASRRRWKAAYIELPLLSDPKIIELHENDLIDYGTCEDDDNSQLKEATNGVELSQNNEDHESIAGELRLELKKLKQAYKTLSSNKDKEISALLGVKDILCNQLRTIDKENMALLKVKEVEAAQATEVAQKLQQNIEELQVAARDKDDKVSRLQAQAANVKKRTLIDDKLLQMRSLAKEKNDEVQKLKNQAGQKRGKTVYELRHEEYTVPRPNMPPNSRKEKGPMQPQPSNSKWPQTRCGPGPVTTLARHLPSAASEKIKELDFSKQLKLNLEGRFSRKFCELLIEKAIVHEDLNIIELRIKNGVSLWITKDVVQHVMDLPIGSAKTLPSPRTAQDVSAAEAEYNKMYTALVYVCKKYKTKNTDPAANQEPSNQGDPTSDQEEDTENHAVNQEQDIEEDGESKLSAHYKRLMFKTNNIELLFKHSGEADVAELIDTDMLVKLYLGALIDRLLLPGSSVYVTAPTLHALHDLEKFRGIDWSYLVFERLKKACCEFKANPSHMDGCVVVFLVVFLDCIEGNLLGLEESCRINLYNSTLIQSYLQEDKPRDRKHKKRTGSKGVKRPENFNLMRWEESCYKQFTVVPVREHGRSKIEVTSGDGDISRPVFPVNLRRRQPADAEILSLNLDYWVGNFLKVFKGSDL